MDFFVAYVLPVLHAVLLVFAAWMLGGWLRGPLNRFLERHTDPTLRVFLVGAARPVVLALSLPAALDAIGVSVTSVVAVLSTVGLAIALSLKGSLSNVASGAILLASRPFEVGDAVTVAGVTGRVRRIDFLFTVVETDDGRRVHVGNDKVIALPMERHAAKGHVRVSVLLRVARARFSPALLGAMRSAAQAVPGARVADDSVLLEEIEPEFVRISVRCWAAAAEGHEVRAALFVALHALTAPPAPSPVAE